MSTFLKRILVAGLALLTGLAIYDQLCRLPEYRTWHGDVFGVPYDFRLPTLDRVLERWWNPEDERLLTPHVFGVGWSVNFARLSNLAQT